LQQPDRGGVLRDAGVRNVAQADDRRRLFGEPAAEGGERQPFTAPVQDAVPGRLLPPGPYPQHGLVAEAGQLVVGAAALEMDLDASELRQPLPQGGEEGGVDRQLVLVHVAAVHLWRSRESGVAGSAWNSSSAVWNAARSGRLRRSPRKMAPPGRTRSTARATTSAR